MIYYFIGIKGSGMASLAKILLSLKEVVKGCDYNEKFYTENGLENIDIDDINNFKLEKEYTYIIGNAFIEHDAFKKIKEQKYNYYTYPEFIHNYFKNYTFIAISGSHGKTQTTKLLCHILDNAIGLIGDGSYKTSKNNKYFVIEACEYKNTFLNYYPDITLILNVDYDHVDFFKSVEDYNKAFENLIKQSKVTIINKDDSKINLLNALPYSKTDFTYENGIINIHGKKFALPIKGNKFAENFMGLYKVLKLLNIDDEVIEKRLKTFKGATRRFETVILNNQVIISDYAHHPSEIKTMYFALKEEYKDKELICIFEPHTITRLEKFIKDYKEVLSLFDKTYLFELFTSVREELNSDKVDTLYNYLNFEKYDQKIHQHLKNKQDVVIAFLGAGVIDKEYHRYINL